MGVLPIVAKPLFEHLGFEFIPPPKISRQTIEEGAKYAPEFVCFPFKAVLGDFILSAQKGAELLVIFGGTGPCRFGWYGVTLQTILRNLGIGAKVIILDHPSEEWAKDAFETLNLTKKGGHPHWQRIKNLIRGINIGWKKLMLLEWAQELARKTRPFEVKKGETDKVLHKVYTLVDKTDNFMSLTKLKKEIKLLFNSIQKDLTRKPIRIGVVGEIYVCIEENLNMHIERKLGNLGAIVDRRGVGLRKYVTGDINLNLEHYVAKKVARKWLKYHAGGESSYSIGYSIMMERKGYDGIVHISPLGCMPEIVAQTIMEKCLNIPILNLVLDEHSGEAGINTRLEAFCDLLKMRRRS